MMKKRETFVSNSSTTSFILAYKSKKICKHCHRKPETPEDVLKYYQQLRNWYPDEDLETVKGAMRIKKELSTYECAFNEEYIKDIIEGIDDAVKAGMNIVMLTIPREADDLREKLTMASDRVIGNIE